MAQEARNARNKSNTPVDLYARAKCQGTAVHLAPGQAAPAGTAFTSIRFTPAR
ncbi:hypothetical protein [Streptomyces sp. WAC06614]|uniref:hypothetical protein n=1 Tax=Streptomyces sp. WAC06614 TaxID=2487416 RepID=UPI0021AEA66E|nr:hypothetical protein [Streptomyces sp. WAC06614]